MNNPQRTIALNKIQWCDYYWINGKGDERRTKPTKPTVNGQEFSTSEWHGTDMKVWEEVREQIVKSDVAEETKEAMIKKTGLENFNLMQAGIESVTISQRANKLP